MSEARPDRAALCEASGFLSGGGLVAFPTETVYGLGANALDADACAKIFCVKGRPADKPLLCHLASVEQAEEIAFLTDEARMLIARFTPGPLTVIVKKKSCVPDIVTAGGDTVGLRFPSNPIAVELIRQCAFPVAAPSANISSHKSPVTASPVINDFYGRINAIIDGGRTACGVESTIVSLAGGRPEIIRHGAVSDGEVREALGL